MSSDVAVDAEALQEDVRKKYLSVAANPHGSFHFHTAGGIGFVEVEGGPPVDTFERAGGEENAWRFEVHGYPCLA